MQWLRILLYTLMHNIGYKCICIYSYSTNDYKLLKNVCPFISIALFYSYKFSNMGISKILK